MQEPSVRTSRVAIAGGLAAVIAIGGLGFFFGRSTAPQRALPAPIPVVTPAPIPLPTPEILGRAQLLELAGIAADVAASGYSVPRTLTDAVGNRFEISLPFGCSGPTSPDAGPTMRWSYDDSTETLRIAADPVKWSGSDWNLGATAGGATVEGFWIGRPWTTAENCPPDNAPVAPPGMEAITLPGQTLAIGQIFAADGGRDTNRKDRSYEIVKRVPPGDVQGSDGFRLHLAGRIEASANRSPFRCVQPAGPEQRPICLIAARIDQVSIKNPRTEEVLATWRPDSI